jgi:hypothetical protein
MKAAIIFTGTGPILVLTTYTSLTGERIAEKLAYKGIKKFIACELPVDLVRRKYGTHFNVILNDVKQSDDLRVLDYNGHNVLYNFQFSVFGKPLFYEPQAAIEMGQEL